MRVIAGIAKGRRLRASSSPEMRPTTDMARQTIFDILGSTVAGTRVLDLFAGAGTLGIEALSRGAEEAMFVESDPTACAVIRENLATTGFAECSLVRRADVVQFLARPAREPFDLVFLDPPYSRGLGFVTRVVGEIAAGNWVRRGGTVVVEVGQGTMEWPAGFRETRTRRFGRTQVHMAVHDERPASGDLPGDV